jgi:FixJ family two-component response regulator
MNEVEPVVFLVDDDELFRRSTERLIRAAGLTVQPFTSARDFLKVPGPEGPACLVLDVQMPGLSGLELQQELVRLNLRIPIGFITAR